MRLSAVQKNTLFLLYHFTHKNRHTVRQRVLYKMINNMMLEEMARPLFPNNFRASCLTLASNELVVRERDDSNRTWLTLTESGREQARVIYDKRLAEQD
ncbi:hypothetical protein O3W44_22295 [Pantoea sp. LMR881]|uniref:hypothetical protein n=1 Tax=Pantoea sp. LMR881 TaxID=3014336 RepID=UPI0022AF5A7B|nr:hypothetical protein [Pantoea sp. LMR881]MCZ4061264.1 hypothetical protein [Pantoea sp. LMR881]